MNDKFSPLSENIQMPVSNNFKVETSPNSYISKIYTAKNNALTLFSTAESPEFKEPPQLINKKSPEAKRAGIKYLNDYMQTMGYKLQNSLQLSIDNCFPKTWFKSPIASIMDNDVRHDACHQTLTDTNINHHHLMKINGESFTVEEVSCMIKYLQDYQNKNNLCQQTNTNCLLTEPDANKVLEEYQKYYEMQKKNTPFVEPASLPAPDTMKKFLMSSFSSVAYVFITTFLRKYIQPYLITRGYNPSTVASAIEALCSAMMGVIFSSPGVIVTDLIMRTTMKKLLKTLGVRENIQQTINNKLATATIWYNFMNVLRFDSVGLLQIGLYQLTDSIGKNAAFALIHQLPKIKKEPPVDLSTMPETASVSGIEQQRRP